MSIYSGSRGREITLAAVFVALVVSLGFFGTASADDQHATTDDQRVARGQRSFQTYCATCHGLSAEGDGPMKKVLKVAPSDLTRLSLHNDGVFPSEEVYRQIDGRQPVRGHGTQEMPVWGLTFQISGNADPTEVEERIWDLVAYLRSIQKPENEPPTDESQ